MTDQVFNDYGHMLAVAGLTSVGKSKAEERCKATTTKFLGLVQCTLSRSRTYHQEVLRSPLRCADALFQSRPSSSGFASFVRTRLFRINGQIKAGMRVMKLISTFQLILEI
jgi:hypothetical protein